MRLRSLPRQKGSELTRRGAEHSHGADSPPDYVRLAGLKNLTDVGVGLRRPAPPSLHPVSSPVGQAPVASLAVPTAILSLMPLSYCH